MWVFAVPPPSEITHMTQMLTQGFKIHVSVTPDDALTALEAIIPVLGRAGVNFKIVGDPGLHYILQSKSYPRGASGKFMTIYPPDVNAFTELLRELDDCTKRLDLRAPRILSDRQYGDSGVLFYRYGGFWPPQRITLDGTRETYLVSPAGEYVPDIRHPYQQIPAWVSDPFTRKRTQAQVSAEEVILDGRFQIGEALSFSNAGGVYAGIDLRTSAMVVIKEARPHTNCWRSGGLTGDAASLLEREFMMLATLQDLEFVPAGIALFEAGGHRFLVEPQVDGRRIRTYWARDEVIVSPYVRNTDRVRSWATKFKRIAVALIDMVLQVHDCGVIIGDLSSDNVLINAENGRMWLIDFESAILHSDCREQKRFASSWATPGFKHPDRDVRRMLIPEDDFYAAGMILAGAMMAVSFFSLDPSALSRFLAEFVRHGIPQEARLVILALTKGDVAAAKDILGGWELVA